MTEFNLEMWEAAFDFNPENFFIRQIVMSKEELQELYPSNNEPTALTNHLLKDEEMGFNN